MGLGKILESKGFNLRERINVYGGLALGTIIPTVMSRYLFVGKYMNPESPLGEALVWGISAIYAAPFTILPFSSALGGLVVGYVDAYKLRNKTLEKEEKCLID